MTLTMQSVLCLSRHGRGFIKFLKDEDRAKTPSFRDSVLPLRIELDAESARLPTTPLGYPAIFTHDLRLGGL